MTANSATYDGILVVSNSTTANISVVANGDIQAGAYGIDLATAFGSIGNINITANGSITGGGGINAFAQGAGSVNVTAVGPITATTEYGIYAEAEDGGNVTVNAGDVTSAGSSGIEVFATGGGDVDVTAGRVSGTYGVFAFNDGPGATVIRTDGAVTGTTQEGIEVSAQGSVRVEVADTVTGATDGAQIEVGEFSSGDISVTGAGGFVGLDGYGLSVENEGSGRIDISGAVVAANGVGVYAAGGAADSGDINVTTGDVTALGTDYEGIYVDTRSLTADVSVTANGDIAADSAGVSASILALSSGDIDVVTNGSVTGGTGILAVNNGSGAITVDAVGPIIATELGIVARSQGGDIIIDAGDVTATEEEAIFAWQQYGAAAGEIVIVTTGDVSAHEDGDHGVLAWQENAVGAGNIDITTMGAVSGPIGIRAQNDGLGTVSVNASGPITAVDVGITARSRGGDITIAAGDVSATGGDGIFAWQETTTGDGDIGIVTTGAISGDIGIHALNDGFGAVSVNASGPITTVGNGIFAQSHGGDVTVGADEVAATGGDGILAWQSNAAGGGIVDIITTAAVSGEIGILALNDGSGAVSVNASGPITATEAGIVARTQGGDITIAAGPVTSGGDFAVFAEQANAAGAGDIDITTSGAVSGSLNGIVALNAGSGAIRIAAEGAVTGAGGAGITALGDAIDVTVAGLVSGSDYGLYLEGGHGGAGDISVTGAGGFAAADGDAAFIFNAGLGTVTYDVSGPVTAINGSGVVVRDTVDGGDISVTTGAVNAVTTDENAIDVRSQSQTADILIVANGALGAGANGVLAFILDAAATGDIDVRTNGSVTAGVGINAQNNGAGGTTVTAVGPVAGTFAGIVATSNGGSVTVTAGDVAASGPAGIAAQIQNGGTGDVTVTAANVAGRTGILASNAGTGDIRITATGTVASLATGTYGVQAYNEAAGGDIIIDVNNVSGVDAGIRVDNHGVGVTELTVRGLVQGGPVGVSVFSDGDQDVRIANEGVIRGAAGLSSDRAIEASGGFIDITNTGTLTGDINFLGDSSLFDNRGTWNAAGGDSNFASIDDELVNAATGSILAASTAGVQDVTIFRGLETFHNAGRLTMGDNGAGDLVMTSADTVFAAGSLLQVDISGQNLADLFATTGTLTLEAGARLDVNFVQPVALGGRYVVARADGGLTGTFDFEDRLLTAFVGLRDGYTATTAYIEIAQLRALIEAGATPNQRHTGAGADSLPDTNPLKTALLLLPDDEAARDAFDRLSGEIHPAARRAMADDSRQVRDAVLDRLSDERADGSVWGRALIEERNTDADGNAAKVEHDARGLIFGADRALTDNLTVGVAGGWFNTDLGILQRNSSGSTRSQQALAYLGARMDRWGLRAGVGYARTSTDTRREIAFPGFSASPTADYDGSVLQGFVEAAWRLPLHGGYVEPFANLTAITADTDAFHEVDGPAALAVEARSESLTATTLGFRFQTDRSSGLSLRGTAGWRNLSGDLEPTGRHAFDGGATFTVLGAAQSDTAAVGALETQWRLSPNVTLGAAWDGIFGNKGQDHAITGRFRIAF